MPPARAPSTAYPIQRLYGNGPYQVLMLARPPRVVHRIALSKGPKLGPPTPPRNRQGLTKRGEQGDSCRHSLSCHSTTP
jgi:hypothetical protein